MTDLTPDGADPSVEPTHSDDVTARSSHPEGTTDEPAPRVSRPPPGPSEGPATDPAHAVDVGRRGFFKAFGRQTVEAAGSVAGAVEAFRRGTGAAAGELFRVGLGGPESTAARLGEGPGSATAGRPVGTPLGAPAAAAFRAPYRLDGDVLVLLDQRALPGTAPDVECRSASDVAAAMRNLVVRGGPVLAQVAAYGLTLTAEQFARSARYRQHSRFRSAASALRAARPSSRAVQWAVDRMEARFAALADRADGRAIADALSAEAAIIATDAALAHAAIGRHAAELLPRLPERALSVLLHGNAGALAGGAVGTVLAALTRVTSDGRSVHAWVTETRPTLEGARSTAWELQQAGIPATVIADGAVGWLLAREPVDALLLGAEWIAANGDTANVIGSLTAAALCFRHRVPVLVCAPRATIDPSTPHGAAIPEETRPADELLRLGGEPLAARSARALNPLGDIVPAVLVSGHVTEHGVLRPPFVDARADEAGSAVGASDATT